MVGDALRLPCGGHEEKCKDNGGKDNGNIMVATPFGVLEHHVNLFSNKKLGRRPSIHVD